MAKRFQVSKFKNTSPQEAKRENWYSELRCGQTSTDNYGITASCKYLAFPLSTTGGGSVCVLPLGRVGKQSADIPHIAAHSGPISDLAFSPFDDGLLATGSDDSSVRVWSIGGEDATEGLGAAVATLTCHDKRIESLAWNPCAADVLATGASSCVKIIDVGQARSVVDFSQQGSTVQWLSWHGNGSLLASTWKDGVLRVHDSRTGQMAQEGMGHAPVKGSCVLWLGQKDLILTTGFSKMRERQFMLHDPRSLGQPLVTQTVDTSTGILLPFYDEDTCMCYLAGKGDTTVRLLELSDAAAKPGLTPLSVFTSQQAQGGACLVPKRALAAMDCEVARMLRLTPSAVIPVAFTVPRKSHTVFPADLFPDTWGPEPGCTAAEWLAGSDAQPALVSMDPARAPAPPRPTPTATPTPPTQHPAPKPTAAAAPQHSSPAPVRAASPPRGASPSPPRAESPTPLQLRTVKVVRSSKFRHIEGRVRHRNNNIEDIRDISLALPADSCLLAANRHFVVYPQAGAGGQLAVVARNQQDPAKDPPQPIRLGQRANALVNPTAVLDFAMSPFDPCTVAVGCEDGHVRVWKVGPEGLQQDTTDPAINLQGHTMKTNLVKFHPLASNILYSASLDHTIRGWDLSKGHEFVRINHPDQVHSLDISYDGQQLASLGRDGYIRLYDARTGSLVKEVDGQGGSRGGRVRFLGATGRLVATGFSGSLRDMRLYQAPSLTLLAHHVLDSGPAPLDPTYDNANGLLFLAGRGEGLVHVFELCDEQPWFYVLTPYAASNPQLAVCFLTKLDCDVGNVEFMRSLKLTQTHIEVLGFHVPRSKREYFQDDLFPATPVLWEPTLTGTEWLQGENALPRTVSLCPPGMQPASSVAAEAPSQGRTVSHTEEVRQQMSVQEAKDALMNRMLEAAQEQAGVRLEQDDMEGVDDDEWDD